MGRAGSGGHSTSSHSSGGHSTSGHSSGGHSTSGHRVSSSSSGRRAGSSGGFSSRSRRDPQGRGYRGGPDYHGVWGFRRPYDRFDGGVHRGFSSFKATFLAVVILFLLMLACLTVLNSRSGGSTVTNTKNREKADTGIAYQNDCIVDEIGWFDNITKTERDLQYFYSKTGVQPYIVLKAYDSALSTDSEKEAYSEDWYTENIDNEGTLLFMYFAEEDTDNDVGYMTLVNGTQISSVMDSEAIEIFWNYLDNQWYGDTSTDDMFVNVFTKTADTIMTKSTTKMDVLKYVAIIAWVICFGCVVLEIMKKNRQYEAEKAEETERILETPLSDSSDDLVDKYTERKE